MQNLKIEFPVIGTDKLADDAVTTPKLADSAVTWPKLAAEVRKSNPNLLDNWYFVGGGSQQGGGQFPINQRGLTEYTASGYTIDRWVVIANPIQVELTASGLQLTPINGAISYFVQKMEPGLCNTVQGEVVTLSVLTDTNLFSGSFVFDAAHRVDLDLGGGIFFRCRGSDGEVSFMFSAGTTTSVLVKAVKLELGPYQTLAYESAGGGWQLNNLPNFTDELMRCMRYQSVISGLNYGRIGMGVIRSDSHGYIEIPLIVPLRASPVVSIVGNIAIYDMVDFKTIPYKYIAFNSMSTNVLTVRVDTEAGELTPGHMLLLQNGNDATAKFILDANL